MWGGIRLLGLTLWSDLKWRSNTEIITKKAYKRLWTIKRLEAHGASQDDLLEVYKKQIRPLLEFSVPVWHPGITKGESKDIERVQKCVTKIILQDSYKTYKQALSVTNLQNLSDRREKICTKFALKAEKHDKFKKWFKVNKKRTNTRSVPSKYCPVISRTKRFERSPLTFLTSLLNKVHMESE